MHCSDAFQLVSRQNIGLCVEIQSTTCGSCMYRSSQGSDAQGFLTSKKSVKNQFVFTGFLTAHISPSRPTDDYLMSA
jgi:hypothetical protein